MKEMRALLHLSQHQRNDGQADARPLIYSLPCELAPVSILGRV
jgi:hypothetical protein